MDTIKTLSGSMDSHQHLFDLVKYLTYFVIQARKNKPDITAADILTRWFSSNTETRQKVLSTWIIEINFLVMPYVYLSVWNSFEMDLTAVELKNKIIDLINEHWLPF